MNGINQRMLKKLTVEDVRQMREMRTEGIHPDVIARTFGVHLTTVNWHTGSFAPETNLENYPHKRSNF